MKPLLFVVLLVEVVSFSSVVFSVGGPLELNIVEQSNSVNFTGKFSQKTNEKLLQ